jgi:hypothetical protein
MSSLKSDQDILRVAQRLGIREDDARRVMDPANYGERWELATRLVQIGRGPKMWPGTWRSPRKRCAVTWPISWQSGAGKRSAGMPPRPGWKTLPPDTISDRRTR